MNTKLLMTLSAILMGVTGMALTFFPEEILLLILPEMNAGMSLVLQIAGALYFGFALLNWMARGNIIGGIYSRPIAIANVTHFFMAGIALVKSASHSNAILLWLVGSIYLIIAFFFGVVLYTHPVKEIKG